jgi:hypothetical protein
VLPTQPRALLPSPVPETPLLLPRLLPSSWALLPFSSYEIEAFDAEFGRTFLLSFR